MEAFAEQALPVVIEGVEIHLENVQRTRQIGIQLFSPQMGIAGQGFPVKFLPRHFAPKLLPEYRLELEPMITLRPKGGLPMKLIPRH